MWIKEISASETFELRHSVLRANFPRSSVHYEQDLLKGAFHLGVFEGESLISVGSFYESSRPPEHIIRLLDIPLDETLLELPFQLRGMATHPDFRGLGAGSLLIHTGKFILETKGASLLWFNARVKAFPFYHRLGFSEIGELFNSYTVPHKVMFKRFGKE